MKEPLDPLFCGLVCTAAVWLSLLLAAARLRLEGRGLAVRLGFGVAAVLLLFVPVTGLPLWNWAFSFCPNPSLPLLGIVCAALWQHLCAMRVFSAPDWRGAWLFGAVAGSILYLPRFGVDVPDVYFWGWHDEVFVWLIAAFAVFFLCCGNRVGVLFLGALAAYSLNALESNNGWDYVVDPFYWIISCGAVAGQAVARWRKRLRDGRDARRTGASALPVPPPDRLRGFALTKTKAMLESSAP